MRPGAWLHLEFSQLLDHISDCGLLRCPVQSDGFTLSPKGHLLLVWGPQYKKDAELLEYSRGGPHR